MLTLNKPEVLRVGSLHFNARLVNVIHIPQRAAESSVLDVFPSSVLPVFLNERRTSDCVDLIGMGKNEKSEISRENKISFTDMEHTWKNSRKIITTAKTICSVQHKEKRESLTLCTHLIALGRSVCEDRQKVKADRHPLGKARLSATFTIKNNLQITEGKMMALQCCNLWWILLRGILSLPVSFPHINNEFPPPSHLHKSQITKVQTPTKEIKKWK